MNINSQVEDKNKEIVILKEKIGNFFQINSSDLGQLNNSSANDSVQDWNSFMDNLNGKTLMSVTSFLISFDLFEVKEQKNFIL